MLALVELFNPEATEDYEVRSAGYTHTVTIWGHYGSVFCDLLDIVDFKSEFAARTYAEACNMGIIV